jgi:hypothetical protein
MKTTAHESSNIKRAIYILQITLSLSGSSVSSIDYRCDDGKKYLELGRHLGINA